MREWRGRGVGQRQKRQFYHRVVLLESALVRLHSPGVTGAASDPVMQGVGSRHCEAAQAWEQSGNGWKVPQAGQQLAE